MNLLEFMMELDIRYYLEVKNKIPFKAEINIFKV